MTKRPPRRAPRFGTAFLAVAIGACSSEPEPGVAPSPSAPPPTATAPRADGGITGDASSPSPLPDAALPDSGSLRGCASGGFLFCEDFDALPTGNAISARWTNDVVDGSLTVDTTRARSGTKALKVHTEGNGRALLRVGGLAPPQNSFYGRMHTWVTAFPSAPAYAHYTLVEAAGTGSGTLVRPIGGQFVPDRGNKALWGIGSDGGPTGDWTRWKETAPSEAGKWVCLEWRLDATDNTVEVWIDGIAKPEMTVSTKNHDGNRAADFVFPKLDRVTFGYWLYQGGSTPQTFDLWLDDIALATSRLGC